MISDGGSIKTSFLVNLFLLVRLQPFIVLYKENINQNRDHHILGIDIKHFWDNELVYCF